MAQNFSKPLHGCFLLSFVTHLFVTPVTKSCREPLYLMKSLISSCINRVGRSEIHLEHNRSLLQTFITKPSGLWQFSRIVLEAPESYQSQDSKHMLMI